MRTWICRSNRSCGKCVFQAFMVCFVSSNALEATTMQVVSRKGLSAECLQAKHVSEFKTCLTSALAFAHPWSCRNFLSSTTDTKVPLPCSIHPRFFLFPVNPKSMNWRLIKTTRAVCALRYVLRLPPGSPRRFLLSSFVNMSNVATQSALIRFGLRVF